MKWRGRIVSFIRKALWPLRKLRTVISRRPRTRAVMIVPYLGYGTAHRLRLRGRVLEAFNIGPPTPEDSKWGNFINMLRRFMSSEIPDARLRATAAQQTFDLVADEEGYFELNAQLNDPLPTGIRQQDVSLHFVGAPRYTTPPEQTATATGQVLIAAPDAQFGIISDIDDTVLKSDVINTLKLLRNTFLKNAHTRLPFNGVAAFYRALQAGTRDTQNPIFYVSAGPWNIYDVLMDFFHIRGIPTGPLFLRDVGLSRQYISRQHKMAHKHDAIQQLLDDHADLPFILIGDSGEHDAEIYLDIAQHNPGRVAAIYIRDVTQNQRLDEAVLRAARQAEALDVAMLLVPDTLAAAQHAVKQGFIKEETLPDIKTERQIDHRGYSLFERPISIF